MTAVERGQELLEWLRASGGEVHGSLVVIQDEGTGLSIYTTTSIPPDAHLISCPFTLAITPKIAVGAIVSLCPNVQDSVKEWNERMVIAVYLTLHWIWADKLGSPSSSSWPETLGHWPYVAALPSSDTFLSPLHFTPAEMGLLKGTNLVGAVEDRRRDWEGECNRVQEIIQDGGFTWERYLTAVTCISSRAFPSKLLHIPSHGSVTTSAVDTSYEEESHPVLLPGVDLLNHARGQPITWLSAPNINTIPSTTIVNPSSLPSNHQVFNNYGPKSNEEFLLGYGFVLDPNPDDTLVLRLGSANLPPDMVKTLKRQGLDASARFMLRKDGETPKDLLRIMRVMLGRGPHHHDQECTHEYGDEDGDDDDEHVAHERERKEMQLELDVLGTLGGMLDDKLDKLQGGVESTEDVREEVKRMCMIYRRGQVEVLETTMDRLAERIERLEGLVDQGMGSCPCCS